MILGKMLVIALAAHGQGISGSDRIAIEFAKRWSKKLRIKFVVWEEGWQMCQRQKLKENKNLKFEINKFEKFNKFGFMASYVLRVLGSIRWALTTKEEDLGCIYSASEFWMDSFPAAILKLRNRRLTWIASWYQTAPNPLQGFSYTEEKRYRWKALIYWLVQLPVKFLINCLADYVLVNNDDEKNVFPKLNFSGTVIVVLGAVDTEKISRFINKVEITKKNDAVFQGRFHPQKGVEELIDIWKLVVKIKPRSKLVIIGDGPLKKSIESKIKIQELEKNVFMTGFLFDGLEKYQILNKSKVVVHPSLFDSGGMATAEAMAFGIPAVGFNLPAYKTYYPKGMIKVKIGDKKAFAKAIIRLLDNSSKRNKIGQQAKKMIFQNYSWEDRADEVLKKIS